MATHPQEMHLEQPVLRLGLLGFAEPETDRLLRWIGDRQPGWPLWTVCDPHGADAWMISGPSAEVLGRDALLIQHPFGSEQRFTLNRAEVDRPLAFGTPLPQGFASGEYFDAADEASVRQRLQRFEAWLRPLRTQFALGSRLVDRMHEFPHGVIRLMLEDRMVAVIDMDRAVVGLDTPARPVDLDLATWIPSPGMTIDIPASFMRLSLQRVMWTFAVRTTRAVLPPRYRERVIHLRRVPRVPARWLDELHLRVMRELMVRPATLDELVVRMSVPGPLLERSVAALYFGGGLTTDPDSARRAEHAARRALVALHFDKTSPETAAQSRPDSADLAALSSMLQDARHSPLRPVDVQSRDSGFAQLPY